MGLRIFEGQILAGRISSSLICYNAKAPLPLKYEIVEKLTHMLLGETQIELQVDEIYATPKMLSHIG